MSTIEGFAALNAPAENQKSPREVAQQFEDHFVRSLVKNMRETAKLGGDDSGMFGSGSGSDTYTSWFDEHMAASITSSSKIGVADVLLRDMHKHGQITASEATPQLPPPSVRYPLRTDTLPQQLGGLDVVS